MANHVSRETYFNTLSGYNPRVDDGTVIQVEHLTHRYGTHPALDDLSFTVQRGESLGLLGPNGAGKTTTVRLVNGLFPPSQGDIRVLGLDPVTQ